MSLRTRLTVLLLLTAALAAAAGAWLAQALHGPLRGWLATAIVAVPVVLWLAARETRPIRQILRALTGLVASYREGDFSMSLAAERKDELGELLSVCDHDWPRFIHAVKGLESAHFAHAQETELGPVIRPLIVAGCPRP